MFQMSFNLIDENDETYSSEHFIILREAHELLNTPKVICLDKMMNSGVIDIPNTMNGRLTFKHKIEYQNESVLKITMG